MLTVQTGNLRILASKLIQSWLRMVPQIYMHRQFPGEVQAEMILRQISRRMKSRRLHLNRKIHLEMTQQSRRMSAKKFRNPVIQKMVPVRMKRTSMYRRIQMNQRTLMQKTLIHRMMNLLMCRHRMTESVYQTVLQIHLITMI